MISSALDLLLLGGGLVEHQDQEYGHKGGLCCRKVQGDGRRLPPCFHAAGRSKGCSGDGDRCLRVRLITGSYQSATADRWLRAGHLTLKPHLRAEIDIDFRSSDLRSHLSTPVLEVVIPMAK